MFVKQALHSISWFCKYSNKGKKWPESYCGNVMCTRQIPGLSSLSYPDRLKTLNIPTLKYRRIRGDMIEVYKILHEVYDPLATIHLPRSTGPTRGHNLKLFQQRSTKDIRKHYFTNRVVKVWNSLPDDVVNAPSVNSFKNRLDSFWDNQPMKYLYEEPYLIGNDLKIYLSEDDQN